MCTGVIGGLTTYHWSPGRCDFWWWDPCSYRYRCPNAPSYSARSPACWAEFWSRSYGTWLWLFLPAHCSEFCVPWRTNPRPRGHAAPPWRYTRAGWPPPGQRTRPQTRSLLKQGQKLKLSSPCVALGCWFVLLHVTREECASTMPAIK